MCGKAMYHKQQVKPGEYLNYTTLNNKVFAGRWGMNFNMKGSPDINVRIENLRTKYVGQMENRGILELDGFFESGFYFYAPPGEQLLLPVIFDNNYDFAILTKDAKGLVKDVHKRQPILIDSGRENTWLEHGKLIQLTELNHLNRINENKLPKAA